MNNKNKSYTSGTKSYTSGTFSDTKVNTVKDLKSV